jgi:hypothetical protein
LAPQTAEQFRTQLVSGAIRAIQHNPFSGQIGPRDHAAPQKFHVLHVQGVIRRKHGPLRRHGLSAHPEDPFFQSLFHRVGKLHPRVRKKLYSIVVKRIVRS